MIIRMICHFVRSLLLYKRLKAVYSRCEHDAKDQNTRDHLVWTAGNGDPMHEVCILPTQGTWRMGT